MNLEIYSYIYWLLVGIGIGSIVWFIVWWQLFK